MSEKKDANPNALSGVMPSIILAKRFDSCFFPLGERQFRSESSNKSTPKAINTIDVVWLGSSDRLAAKLKPNESTVAPISEYIVTYPKANASPLRPFLPDINSKMTMVIDPGEMMPPEATATAWNKVEIIVSQTN